MSKVRRATHAGSWYSDNPSTLTRQLDDWIADAPQTQTPARAIIAPHAGYYFCGSCGGHAYRQMDPSKIKRVFILGPSHHIRLATCALSRVEKYQTPLYDLTIDKDVYRDLHDTGMFEQMSIDVDEDEHSLEMHLPYVAKVMESHKHNFTIVPILVGSLSPEKEREYGKLFSSYLADPHNFFVISSDFCHWGRRFRYTFYDEKCGNISQSIEALDDMAMKIIEDLNPSKFTEYIKEYQNTICGRHPIGVLLQAVTALQQNGNGHKMSLKFMKYAQSSRCESMEDSSVSYAAGALVIQ